MKKIIRLSRRIFENIKPYKNKYCCLCEKKVGNWLAYEGGWKKAPPFMKVLDIIGSDLDNFTCPSCESHDRERHLWLYLQATNILKDMKGASILHFAPEKHLSEKIKAQNPSLYIKADLYPNSTDTQKVDLLDIPYSDNSYDFVIANHVLEHVENYHIALQEINRILKPGKWAILQTPYSNVLQKTWEDSGIKTNEQRLQIYGQKDHVRLFGNDIMDQITFNNFTSHIKYHNNILGDKPIKKYGINPQEPFMLFVKNT